MRTGDDHIADLYRSAVHKALDYIHLHLDEPLSLEAVAGVVAFSPYYFHRMFKAAVQEPFYSYIQRVRAEKAARQLAFDESKPLRDIGLDCGFESFSSFSRAFKRLRGLSPSDYRARYAIGVPRETTLAERRFRLEIAALTGAVPVAGLDRIIAYAERAIHDVTTEHLPPLDVAYTRVRGLASRGIDPRLTQAFARTHRLAERSGLLAKQWERPASGRTGGSGAALPDHVPVIGASLDDLYITPLDRCRYDACVPIRSDAGHPPLPPELERQQLPGGRYAVLRIADTPLVTRLLGDLLVQCWLPHSGYRLDTRPFLEIYYQDPTHHPLQLVVMDLCVPIRPRTRHDT